mgnify:CR=1 FL=1
MHGIIKCQHQGQMSESFPTAAFLSISGGLQDAYTYVFRGKVFANAQTGNIVLLSQNICERNWLQSAHYFVPLAAFAIGIIVAEQIRGKYQNVQNIHWRQIVLLLEMILLFLVSFLPQSLDMLANALVSFSCAMQVQTFRKVNGYAFASTMCIGNMRSGMEALSAYIRTHVADGLFCREIDGLFCRSSPDIIVRRRCVLSHKRRGWLQPSPSFRYSRNLALQDELYHPVINNGPAVLVCVDKRLGTGPVNQSRDAG